MSSTRRQPDRTRARLVEVGFEEIYRRGFQPAGLDTIVERAGVTKQHSTITSELGYTVLDEGDRLFHRREVAQAHRRRR